MGKWIEQQDVKKEKKEKDKVRNEKLAGYFLNLSQLTFVALVLGGITPLYLYVFIIPPYIYFPSHFFPDFVFNQAQKQIPAIE